jgi:hypothetical protein
MIRIGLLGKRIQSIRISLLVCLEHKSYRDYKYREDVIYLIKKRIEQLLFPLPLSLSLLSPPSSALVPSALAASSTAADLPYPSHGLQLHHPSI